MADDITSEDESILRGQNTRTLARWWCILNRGEWPRKLPDPELPRTGATERIWAIMCWIDGEIGHKECLRQWSRGRMTDAEFEDFWRGRYENDEAAAARYRKWSESRLPAKA